MDHHVAGVDQHPVAALLALDRDVTVAGLFQSLGEMVGDRHDLAVRAARSDHHVVGESRFALEVDDDDVLGLVVVE